MPDLDKVEKYLTKKRHELHLPGLAVGIVKDNRVIYLRGFGKADQTGRPITPQTPFILGSLSKSFTAMAIMQLAEGGKINLDESVLHYLSWFRVADEEASSSITIRHLLTHTSGLSRWCGRELLAGQRVRTLEDAVRALKYVKLTQPVGKSYQYSNYNYSILGLIVQMVSGEPFEVYIQQHIFRPLRMYHSFTSEMEAVQDGMAEGYQWWYGFPFVCHFPYLIDALPAAYVISSVEDMSHYLLACLNIGAVGGASPLSSQGFAELYRPQIRIAENTSYALGWRVEQLGKETIFRHSGETANYLAEMVIVPESRIGVVVLMNINNGAVAQLGVAKIATSTVSLLLDFPAPKPKIPFRSFYMLVDLFALMWSIWQLVSFLRILRSRRIPLNFSSFASIVRDMVVPLVFFWKIPRLFDAPWALLRLYVPDISTWLLLMGLISLGKVIVRSLKMFLNRDVD